MSYLGRKGASAALTSADIPDGSVTTAKLIDSSVTSAKIGVDVIVAEDIANNAVTVAELADNAVTQAKLADDAVGTAELANDVAISTTGAITTTGAFTSIGIDDNSNALAMTIDSSERVGIGTDAPGYLAHIKTPTAANAYVNVWERTSGAKIGMWLDTTKAQLETIGAYDLKLDVNGGSSGGVFIDKDNGNVGIGTDAPGAKLQVKSTTSTTGLDVAAGTSSSDYNLILTNRAGSANYMYIRGDSYCWVASTWATSDRREKENISYVTDDILPKIETLKFAKFDLKIGQKNCYGFIAQDVETIFPDCISDTAMPDILYKSDDEIPEGKEIGDIKKEGAEQKNINYNYLFSHLVKAIQELSAKVTALESA